jgi:multimeric flavodoxin WrbA
MKILAIIGGRKGSSSEAMAKLALHGAKEAGAENLMAVRLLDLDIGFCTGCNACVEGLLSGKGKGECVIKDDFQWLSEQILQSDGVIVSMPIFEKTVPGYFKSLCDRGGPSMDAALRMKAVELGQENNRPPEKMPDPRTFKKRLVSFIAHGGSDWNQSMMPVMMHFAIPLNMEIIDQILIPWDRQKLLDRKIVDRLQESGRHMFHSLTHGHEKAEYIGMEGHCPVCHNNVFLLGKKATDTCCSLCGVTGTLKVDNVGNVKVDFKPDVLNESHVSMAGKRKHLDDLRKIGGVSNEVTHRILEKKKEYCSLFSLTTPD